MALMRMESSVILGPPSAIDVALEELERVYGFICARVGNREDAEDLTQQVAMKALPKLREGAAGPEIKGYLYATARTVLASFWEARARLQVSQLPDDLATMGFPTEVLPEPRTAQWVEGILQRLRPSHRRILELRFLRGYSLKETAAEMGKTIGSVKVMQVRALHAAAGVMDVESMSPVFLESRAALRR